MIIQDRLDTDISSILFNIDIFKEHAEIEVFNASNTTGLASNRARWIQNLGANVVKIGNADHVQDEVDLYCVNPDQYPETIRELRKIFSSNVTLIQEKYYNRQIGDIVIVMGRDY
jgi:calcineurin-like phosphoesterase